MIKYTSRNRVIYTADKNQAYLLKISLIKSKLGIEIKELTIII